MCSLMMGGVLEKLEDSDRLCPRRWLGPLHHRSHPAWLDVRPDLCAVDSKLSPRELLRRCYVDSLVHDPDSLRHLIDIMGQTRSARQRLSIPTCRPGALIESWLWPTEARNACFPYRARIPRLEGIGLPG